MNGILNAVTAIQQWQSAGGLFKFDAAFAASISGYPKGAELAKADASGTWRNLIEGNTSNPDTGGAGWIDGSSGGLLNVQIFKVGGTYTPTLGTTSVVVEVQGGGGGGGGIPSAPSATTAGAGGGGGGYSLKRLTSGFTGGITVTVGAGGVGVSGTGTSGAGGSSSFGALVTAAGGTGGRNAGTTTTNVITSGVAGDGGAGTLADVSRPGNQGGSALIGPAFALAGAGGQSHFGSGAPYSSVTATSASAGMSAADNTGGGGSGAVGFNNGIVATGGNGGSGIVIVWEYK
jgi:hypothetical protein